MENVAFTARNSVKKDLNIPAGENGIEIFSSKLLAKDEAIFIGRKDFSGVPLNHYYISRSDAQMESVLEHSGISASLISRIILSSRQEGRTKKFPLPKIMAVANATPDSFYPGSRLDNGHEMLDRIIAAEPDIIDVGGESTRPGSQEISTREEIERIAPVIEYILDKTNIPISLDTRHPDVLEHFAGKVQYANDISGFQDERMIRISAEHSLSCITMHMRGKPGTMQSMTHYVDLIPEILSFLLESAAKLEEGGIEGNKVIIDPGIGFSKDFGGNLEILKEIESFRLGYEILVGASRKSFIGKITGEETQGRLPGTLAVTTYLAMKGVDLIRVHDPKENLQAIKVVNSIVNYGNQL